jgi:hypothetical protein
MAVFDIFRFQDGKIAEHWDILQEVPATTANGNGMFSTLSRPRTEALEQRWFTAYDKKLVTAVFWAPRLKPAVAGDLVCNGVHVAQTNGKRHPLACHLGCREGRPPRATARRPLAVCPVPHLMIPGTFSDRRT